MKKILLVFLLVFTTTSFSWEIVEQVNEFQEKTGKVIIVKSSKDNKVSFSILKSKDSFNIGIISSEYIGGKGVENGSIVKIKLQDGEIVELIGIVPTSNPNIVLISHQPEIIKDLLDKMKSNDSMKVVIEKYNGGFVFSELDIKNLNNFLSKIK